MLFSHQYRNKSSFSALHIINTRLPPLVFTLHRLLLRMTLPKYCLFNFVIVYYSGFLSFLNPLSIVKWHRSFRTREFSYVFFSSTYFYYRFPIFRFQLEERNVLHVTNCLHRRVAQMKVKYLCKPEDLDTCGKDDEEVFMHTELCCRIRARAFKSCQYCTRHRARAEQHLSMYF